MNPALDDLEQAVAGIVRAAERARELAEEYRQLNEQTAAEIARLKEQKR